MYISLGGFFVLLVVVILTSGFYFFKFAEVRSPNEENKADNSSTIRTENFQKNKKFIQDNAMKWEIQSSDHLKLVSQYIPAKNQTLKTVLLNHGYRGNHSDMSDYAVMFYNMG